MRNKINSSIPVDNDLIVGIRNGAKGSLDALYSAHFPMILQFVINNNGNEDDAKDIFQEAVIVLYTKITSGNFELNSKLKTYIYAVCRHLWLKKLNQSSRFSAQTYELESVAEVETDLEQHEEQNQQFKQMQVALGQLGEPCKTIIEEFYLHSRSMQEICEQFGYTNADNAKTQKYKCLQRLKKLFFKDGGIEL
ncbi:MAG: RNA polymerase sigma factor [Sphingobacteriaceae bacterium]